LADRALKTSSRRWLSAPSPIPLDGGGLLVLTRLGVAIISASATIVGLLPAALYLNRGAGLWFVIAVVILFSLVVACRIRLTHLQQPSLFEFVAVWLTAISQGALVSFLTLQTYLIVRAANWLTKTFLRLVGYSLTIDWSGPATGIAVGFGGLLLLGIVVITTKGVRQVLYPPVAGYGTPFRGVARSLLGKVALSIALAGAIAFTVFAFVWPLQRLGFWWCFFFASGFFMSTMYAWQMSQEKTAPRAFSSVEEAIGAMLRVLGFAIVEQPRTGLPEIDPYLADLDFAISRGDRSFAMLVQETNESRPIVAQDVSRVAIAAHALSAAARKQAEESPRIEAVLVVVGISISNEVFEFAMQQDVKVIHVVAATDLLPESKEGTVFKDAAVRLFHPLLEDRAEQSVAAMMASPLNQFSLSRDQLGRS
jgi:hypothetical protein